MTLTPAGKRPALLVVAAHPDDEVLGCGAAMARHAAEGDRVWTLILGEGVASRRGLAPAEKKRLIRRLDEDAAKANAILGAEKVILKKFPDNAFDTVPLLSVVQAIEEVVAALRPGTVLTHHAGDLNIDHRVTADAVRTACRPLPASPVRQILAFEIASSTEWAFGSGPAFEPNFFVDAAGFLDAKVRALAAYRGEARPFPHPRSETYLRALAAVRGAQSGREAAEAFMLVRKLA